MRYRSRSSSCRRGLRALLVAVAIMAIGTVFTATNSVPATSLGQRTSTTTANNLRPSSCSGVSVTTKVSGSGTFSGTTAANLVTAGAAVDTITALGGSDCVLGGAGNDSIEGGAGTDVCIGGAGTDTFTACETQIQ